jgi:folate-dependent phosphoribosylglycinamide formyltransferase PurN
MMSKPKIVIMTNGNLPSSMVLSKILNIFSNNICCVYITTKIPGNKKNSNLAALIALLRGSGVNYVFFKLLYNKIMPYFVKKGLIEKVCKEKGIIFRKTNDVNSPGVVNLLKKIRPTILISVSATEKISEEVLHLIQYPINIHYSLLPKYCGISPYIHCLINKEDYTGVTVHLMTSELDKGDIISFKEIPILERSAMELLFRQACIGNDLLYEVVSKLINNNTIETKQQKLSERTYYAHPLKKDLITLRKNSYVLWRYKDVFSFIEFFNHNSGSKKDYRSLKNGV